MPSETVAPQPVPSQPVPPAGTSPEILKKSKCYMICMHMYHLQCITHIEPEMFHLMKFVIPKIMNEWVYVAYAFRYDLATIQSIKQNGRQNPKTCCEEFFTDWLSTEHGAKAGPKTWSTLLDVLKQIDDIAADIKEDITKEVLQLKN